MNSNTEIKTLIRRMLSNPKAWTKYEKSREFIYGDTYEPSKLHVGNSRINVTASLYRERDIATGHLWWKRISTSPEKKRVIYDVRGPNGYVISTGALEEQDYFLVESLFERTVLGMVRGEEWPDGPPCEYCGSILSGGKCPSCGAFSN